MPFPTEQTHGQGAHKSTVIPWQYIGGGTRKPQLAPGKWPGMNKPTRKQWPGPGKPTRKPYPGPGKPTQIPWPGLDKPTRLPWPGTGIPTRNPFLVPGAPYPGPRNPTRMPNEGPKLVHGNQQYGVTNPSNEAPNNGGHWAFCSYCGGGYPTPGYEVGYRGSLMANNVTGNRHPQSHIRRHYLETALRKLFRTKST